MYVCVRERETEKHRQSDKKRLTESEGACGPECVLVCFTHTHTHTHTEAETEGTCQRVHVCYLTFAHNPHCAVQWQIGEGKS